MAGKILIDIQKPTTQTVEAVKALLAWRGRAADPLPSFVEMGDGDNRLVLVLSNKKDCFYVTTARDCSCPAHNWHPGQRCKHQRAHFPETATIQKQTMAETLEQADKNLSRMPYQYRRMVEASREAAAVDSDSIMPRAPFKPFLEDELRPAAIRAAKASSGDLLAEMHSARWDAEDDCKPTGTAKEPSSPLSVIDCHDTTALDVAYHSIKADREMWPAEV